MKNKTEKELHIEGVDKLKNQSSEDFYCWLNLLTFKERLVLMKKLCVGLYDKNYDIVSKIKLFPKNITLSGSDIGANDDCFCDFEFRITMQDFNSDKIMVIGYKLVLFVEKEGVGGLTNTWVNPFSGQVSDNLIEFEFHDNKSFSEAVVRLADFLIINKLCN